MPNQWCINETIKKNNLSIIYLQIPMLLFNAAIGNYWQFPMWSISGSLGMSFGSISWNTKVWENVEDENELGYYFMRHPPTGRCVWPVLRPVVSSPLGQWVDTSRAVLVKGGDGRMSSTTTPPADTQRQHISINWSSWKTDHVFHLLQSNYIIINYN